MSMEKTLFQASRSACRPASPATSPLGFVSQENTLFFPEANLSWVSVVCNPNVLMNME